MENLYVIKFEDNTYYTGYHKKSKKLHQAKIYTSLKFANEAGEIMKRRTGLSYSIKQVRIEEIEEIEE